MRAGERIVVFRGVIQMSAQDFGRGCVPHAGRGNGAGGRAVVDRELDLGGFAALEGIGRSEDDGAEHLLVVGHGVDARERDAAGGCRSA